MAQPTTPPAVMPVRHMGAGLCSGCPTSHPASCWWRVAWRTLLALAWLRAAHYEYLGNKPVHGRKPVSPYNSDCQINRKQNHRESFNKVFETKLDTSKSSAKWEFKIKPFFYLANHAFVESSKSSLKWVLWAVHD